MSDDIAVRIGQEELGRIFNLKENLDHLETVQSYVGRYQKLGWVLTGVKVQGGAALDLDFSLPLETWSSQFETLSAEIGRINLGVRTGKPSKLLVLEVNKGEGALALDQLGDWRADCIAVVGHNREQHYYTLPAEAPTPPSYFQAPQVMIYGEGGLVLVPPSLEPQAQEPWSWVEPPWERPPQPPKAAVWQFLKQHIPALQASMDIPSWSEIYRLISPYGQILKALLLPAPSSENYYSGILQAALSVGLSEPDFLLGLLWHAPHGEAYHRPERLEDLKALAAAARSVPSVPGTEALPQTLQVAASNFLAQHLSAEPLAAGGLETPAAPQNGDGAAPGKFDQSVSGQFFQLLSGLGEKVINESCRYEAVLSGLGAKKAELDKILTDWQQSIASPHPQPEDQKFLGPTPGAPGPIELEWATLVNQETQQRQQSQEVQDAANDFLAKNPDLAADRDQIRKVLFCLRNYISINPECARLSIREKLEKAGKMARGF